MQEKKRKYHLYFLLEHTKWIFGKSYENFVILPAAEYPIIPKLYLFAILAKYKYDFGFMYAFTYSGSIFIE